MADEPTGNLDSRTSQEIIALFRQLNHERGITIILVTHDREIAANAHRTVTLMDGLIISDQRRPDAQPPLPPTPS
jgi:putative ABC transport system ATP-binding protein